jgi:hypothetical protein
MRGRAVDELLSKARGPVEELFFCVALSVRHGLAWLLWELISICGNDTNGIVGIRRVVHPVLDHVRHGFHASLPICATAEVNCSCNLQDSRVRGLLRGRPKSGPCTTEETGRGHLAFAVEQEPMGESAKGALVQACDEGQVLLR